MGGCCSCCFSGETEESASNGNNKETELVAAAAPKSLSISRAMTAPTVELANGNQASGYGLALVGVVLEQDAAYWEVHIEIPEEGGGISYEVMFGVATKKDRKFYNALQEQEEEMPSTSGTDLMRPVPVSNGDVVGIAVQQSDLPMVQFLLNGEPLHSLSVNRFRGNVYPAVYLPENEGLTAKVVFAEREFAQLSPHARFGPVIVARGLL
mmetsp:Transcript_26126/g.72025  ORF Transcript_26126/g.72025 Transcript_26126/m.72025 type:complete len:210 (-) Transcript_26126:688-1317(-)|eukprot:CAMPEP_0168742062 /NCGR_PEP_ID=MMETSP0724-20121128/12843_1 /TAXON_ID=265536 /ORGANISM="Amphiprora sp., Strain CCMP467" /LENGTH=209 /DNA_ID=CAMNT_0008789601 /DNA_START=19 /DNA_END=648 /DNA_ORIENTATION=+